MIPSADPDGNLPPGIHSASWEELEARFGQGELRSRLLRGLRRAAIALKVAGCPTLYVDGSFVSTKDRPQDFDACWEPQGVVAVRLDPVLLNFNNGRLAQKLKYGGELFPSSARAQAHSPHRTFLEFFQVNKDTGERKGVVSIDLGSLP